MCIAQLWYALKYANGSKHDNFQKDGKCRNDGCPNDKLVGKFAIATHFLCHDGGRYSRWCAKKRDVGGKVLTLQGGYQKVSKC